MTAKEYLRQVKYLRTRIWETESLINAVEESKYYVKGVDISREKVNCTRQSDISEKIVETMEKRDKLEAQRKALEDAKEDAEKRITKMKDHTSRTILLEACIYNRKRTQIMQDLKMPSATYARHKKKAVQEFEAENHAYLCSLISII